MNNRYIIAFAIYATQKAVGAWNKKCIANANGKTDLNFAAAAANAAALYQHVHCAEAETLFRWHFSKNSSYFVLLQHE